ncbi:hypothetical protein ACFV0L_32355 [Streptosporangium canum]|uniref:hypothetical protein n=1 Tax=Streptosporangium canum TaxID=324952 RepID=UPI003697FFA2
MTETSDEPNYTARPTFTKTAEVGGWRVQAVWRDGSAGPVELHITAKPDANSRDVQGGITTGTLRAIPLPEMTEEARQPWPMIESATRSLTTHAQTADKAVELIRSTVEAEPRPGRSGRPDLFYALVAYAYFAYSRLGTNAIRRLAEATGVERRTAENWVNHARDKRGMLTDPPSGKAGGELTEKAKQLLLKGTES